MDGTQVHVKDGTSSVPLQGTAANGAEVDVTRIAAGETHIGQSTWPLKVIEVTATVDTAIYAAGDVLTDAMTLASALRVAGNGARLRSIVLIDVDDEAAMAIDVYFFKSSKSLGAKNAVPAISDADVVDCLGFISIATADAKDVGGAKVYTKANLDLPLIAAAGVDIFAQVVLITGTPTFTAATDLKFKFGIEQH